VYTNASDPLNYETSLLEKMAKITYEGLDSLVRQTSALDLSGPVSHQLFFFLLAPLAMSFESSFPTRYIYEKASGQPFYPQVGGGRSPLPRVCPSPKRQGQCWFHAGRCCKRRVLQRGRVESCSMMKSNVRVQNILTGRTPRSDIPPISSSRLHGTSYCHQYQSESCRNRVCAFAAGTFPKLVHNYSLRMDTTTPRPAPRKRSMLSSMSRPPELQPSFKLPLRGLIPLSRGVSNGCRVWVSRTFGILQCQRLTPRLIFHFLMSGTHPQGQSISEKYLLTVESLPEN
jgi:hypothetical protein